MTDEFASAYSTIVVATKSRARYWDGDAVRVPAPPHPYDRLLPDGSRYARRRPEAQPAGMGTDGKGEASYGGNNPAGAPLLDWWHVPAHTVMERLVLSMCPGRVCTTCGEPSRRIVRAERIAEKDDTTREKLRPQLNGSGVDHPPEIGWEFERETLGWSDCGHNTWREGVTLDPFQRNEDDVSTRYLIGDVFDGLATIPDHSVDLIVSSPPFLALRSYLPADHEHKALEIGSEATPGEFLDKLLDVVEECARVLAPHGSLVFELGDTYSGQGGENHLWDTYTENGQGGTRYPQNEKHPSGAGRRNTSQGWPLDKSKVLVPQLFAIALAYGFNPLTGRTTDPWRVRNTVAWCRPNPPVGRDGDKFRPATSFLTVATKARDRYWDGDAVRSPGNSYDRPESASNGGGKEREIDRWRADSKPLVTNPAGAPLLDYWVIPTEPYSGSHYATFPRALVVPLVKSMCPSRVCRVCGEPSRRIVGEAEYERTDSDRVPARLAMQDGARVADGVNQHLQTNGANTSVTRSAPTLGWSECACEWPPADAYAMDAEGWTVAATKWRSGLVLDPFAGSGTTLAVASGHGLDSIGIDIDHRNAELAAERVGGLFLETETLAAALPSEGEQAK